MYIPLRLTTEYRICAKRSRHVKKGKKRKRAIPFALRDAHVSRNFFPTFTIPIGARPYRSLVQFKLGCFFHRFIENSRWSLPELHAIRLRKSVPTYIRTILIRSAPKKWKTHSDSSLPGLSRQILVNIVKRRVACISMNVFVRVLPKK